MTETDMIQGTMAINMPIPRTKTLIDRVVFLIPLLNFIKLFSLRASLKLIGVHVDDDYIVFNSD